MSVPSRTSFCAAFSLALVLVAGGCGQDKQAPRGNESQAIRTYVEGVNAYKAGDESAAVESLRESIQGNPGLIMPRAMLGRIYKQRGDYASAAEYYEALTRLDPFEVDHHYQLGVSYQMLKRLQDATKSYRNALKLDPNNFGANMNLGLAYLALGDSENAVLYTQRAAALRPDSAEAAANLAVALDSTGQYDKAEIAYRKSLELAPGQAGTLINYANNLLAQQKWEDALQVLEKTLKMEDTPYLRKRMGDAYALGKRYSEALEQYDMGLQKNPRYYNALNEKAQVMIAQYQQGMELEDKKRDDALSLWRQSLEINPSQPRIKALVEEWERRMFSR